MPKGSIAVRLFWFSLLWLIAALAFTAFLLTDLYSRSLDSTLQETLEFHLETLIGETADLGTNKIAPDSVADPRFARPASGWYWQIQDQQGETLGASPSLVGTVLPKFDGQDIGANMFIGIEADGFGTQIRLISRQINKDAGSLVITVAGNLDEISQLVANFRGQTLIVLGAVGAMLALMSAILARFALRPIGRMRNALEAVRDGERQSVEGNYPQEIAPLADEINELLRSNTSIIERARSQVGNFAHGLKTPLAVLRNEASAQKSELSGLVLNQTDKMSDLVSRYLDRAQLAARTAIVGRRANTDETLTKLTRVMTKLHPDKQVIFLPAGDNEIWFRGEETDLEEMVGNLLDNACKWAKSRVEVSTKLADVPQAREFQILIEDDGSGLTAKEVGKVLQRGVRLDEKAPGSGLGLDIVKELAEVYGGKLALGKCRMGGLGATLTLPVAGSNAQR